jgi:NAD(P)-dependent dehydrogenase (short-subunit alcohol dehydrogenase family)
MWQNKRQLFSLLFEASATTLLEVAADPRHLGVQPCFLSILHTWGQTLTPHPHIHCVVPGGGLAPDHSRWISSRSSFLLAVKVLSQLPLGKITAEHIDETFDTNVKGTIFTVQKALPLMGKGGSIILTGSSAGTTGAPTMSVYSASKAAVRNLARTWAEDLKGTGIRVNVLSPGPTATELAKTALGEEGQKVYASMTPLQRMADPAEIGAAAAFLASDDSSFMTASELAVDGGLAQI